MVANHSTFLGSSSEVGQALVESLVWLPLLIIFIIGFTTVGLEFLGQRIIEYAINETLVCEQTYEHRNCLELARRTMKRLEPFIQVQWTSYSNYQRMEVSAHIHFFGAPLWKKISIKKDKRTVLLKNEDWP